MIRNSFGHIFTLTTFGESHGEAIGGVIDGMPVGIEIDMDFIQKELDRRRPGQSKITTQRKESDTVKLLSGIFEGKTTGAPIGFVVFNNDQHSSDYDNMRNLFRPSHADFTYFEKYGIRDHRGGGRSSARITISRCVGGALAKLALKQLNISIQAYVSQVGNIKLDNDYRQYDLTKIEENVVRCPDLQKANEMEELIVQMKADGDTIGGVVSCVIKGCPVGLGERGSEQNDAFIPEETSLNIDKNNSTCTLITTETNHSGGIQGGISNGQDIFFRVAFKPVATVLQQQKTVDIQGRSTLFTAHGRHDPCVLPRAVPIVEAMAAMVILDNFLLNKTTKL